MLNDSWSVTVDNNSNVYVASFNFHKVVELEPNVRQGRQLICSDDGLVYCTGIYFDKSKKQFGGNKRQRSAFPLSYMLKPVLVLLV